MKRSNARRAFSEAIGFWYLFLFILALCSTVNVAFSSSAPGLVLVAAAYLSFGMGFFARATAPPKIAQAYRENRYLSMALLIPLSYALAIYSINFYTGKGVTDVLVGALAGDSLYNSYQSYFADEDLANFTLSKVPAIASGAALKFILLYSFITILVLRSAVGKKGVIQLLAVSLAYLYFAFGRGTSFELFELLVVGVFALILRSESLSAKASPRAKWFVLVVGALFVFLYSYNVSARYGFDAADECAAARFCLNRQSLIYSISPSIGELIFRLSAYFLFGVVHLTTLIETIFGSPALLITTMVPGAGLITASAEANICESVLDCGAMWVPDISRLLTSVGFLGLAAVVFLVGRLGLAALDVCRRAQSLSSHMVLYFVFLFALSLPVGNFVTASSPNLINATIALGCFAFAKLKLRSKR